MDYEVCEFCGEDVSVGATFCRECGASFDVGWTDDDYDDEHDDEYDDDEFEDDFEYDEYVGREFPEHAKKRPSSLRLNFVGIVALILVVAFLLPYIFSLLSLF